MLGNCLAMFCHVGQLFSNVLKCWAIVSHVFEKMSDRVIRETVGKIVSRVAEQMVRDELERLKDKLRSDDA